MFVQPWGLFVAPDCHTQAICEMLDQVAHFVCDTVREQLDLSAIFSAYDEERGYPPYHPTTRSGWISWRSPR